MQLHDLAERATSRAESVSSPDSLPVNARSDSDQPLSPFARKAAAILDGELKSGESSLGDGSAAASPPFRPTVEWFRTRGRQLVDTVVDVLGREPEQLARLASPTAALGGPFDGEDSQSVPLLAAPPTVIPGHVGRVLMMLENDDVGEADLTLYATDLVGGLGHRIPAAQVEVTPSSVTIPPGGSADVRIEIRVPSETPRGHYGGLLRANDVDMLQAVIQLSVGP